MYCWQADEEHPETLSIPVLIPSLSRRQITDIACGTSHCIAFSSIISKAYSWGTNYCGELGIGSVNPVNEPTEIVMPNDDKLTQVSCGNAFTIGISLPLKSVQSGSGTFIPSSEILQQISRGCALDSVQFDSGDVSTIQQTDSTMDAVLLTSFQSYSFKDGYESTNNQYYPTCSHINYSINNQYPFKHSAYNYYPFLLYRYDAIVFNRYSVHNNDCFSSRSIHF